jgi:hypothetical protein
MRDNIMKFKKFSSFFALILISTHLHGREELSLTFSCHQAPEELPSPTKIHASQQTILKNILLYIKNAPTSSQDSAGQGIEKVKSFLGERFLAPRLSQAVLQGKPNKVKGLLLKGGNVEATYGAFKDTLLHMALQEDYVERERRQKQEEVFSLLLEEWKNLKVNNRHSLNLPDHPNTLKATPLHYAVYHEYYNSMEELMRAGANPCPLLKADTHSISATSSSFPWHQRHSLIRITVSYLDRAFLTLQGQSLPSHQHEESEKTLNTLKNLRLELKYLKLAIGSYQRDLSLLKGEREEDQINKEWDPRVKELEKEIKIKIKEFKEEPEIKKKPLTPRRLLSKQKKTSQKWNSFIPFNSKKLGSKIRGSTLGAPSPKRKSRS